MSTASAPHTVITGYGLVHPAGEASALSSAASLQDLEEDRLQAAVGELTDFFPRQALRRLPLYVRAGLLAAVKALHAAALWPCPKDIPVVIGTAYSCQKTSFDFMDSILDFCPRLASPLSFSHAVNNMAAGLFSIMLQSTGPCMTVNNGELSFAGALQTAMGMLESDKASAVLVGAVDEADPRFCSLFPQKALLLSAAFFCLRRKETGLAVELVWEDREGGEAGYTADGHAIPLSTAGAGDSLFQPLACAVCCAGGHDSASITQTAAGYGLSATIRLRKVGKR